MKKHAINLLIFLAALMFAWIVAEIATRFFLSAPQTVHVSPVSTPSSNTTTQKELSIGEHPDEGGVYTGSPTGKRLRPNRRITIENHRLSHQKILIETNSLGYRNPEIGDKQGLRVLFLGDSVTFQDYLNEEHTFVRQVQDLAQQSGKNWETINAGVGAISLKTELAILRETGLALKPDVVVLGFYLNDFQESKGVHIVQLPGILNHSWFLHHLTGWLSQLGGQHLLETDLDLMQWKQKFSSQHPLADGHFNESPEAFNRMILANFHDYGATWSPETWQYMKPLFSELKSLSEQHHFQLVIVGFPVYQQVYTEFLNDVPQQQLKQIGKDLDIPVLDLLPAFRVEALRLRDASIYHQEAFLPDLFYDQCHHTPAGSKLVADQIFSFLDASHRE